MTARIYLTAAIGIMGIGIGYIAQRSRMCFVAGFRDYLLVRDRELLLGFFSFFLTIWMLTTLLYGFGLLKEGAPEYGEVRVGTSMKTELSGGGRERGGSRGEPDGVRIFSSPPALDRFMLVTFAGGWVIGILSTFAGGCVLRQHVLAAQGSRDAAVYLAGFYLAVVAYSFFLSRFFSRLY